MFGKIIISLLPLSVLPISCSNNSSNLIFISSVHDGDTFTNSNGTKYRLFGVDTPEVSNQYKSFEQTQGIEQIYAQNATLLAKSLIESKSVSVEEKTVDTYNRHVAKVKSNGKDLAFELINAGLARVAYFDVTNSKSPYFSNDYSYYESLVWAQRKAFEQHLGIWRDPAEFKIIFPKS